MLWYEKESQNTFLRSARRHPRARYTLHVEAVHLSRTGHLCGGYRAMQMLEESGSIRITEQGLVEVLP